MKAIILIASAILITACDQAVIKGTTKTINSDHLSYLCIDNVKYIKTMNQTGHYSLTVKFGIDGDIEVCRSQSPTWYSLC